MKRSTLSLFISLFLLPVSLFTADTPPTHTDSGIALDTPWKISIYQFSQTNLSHSAWGLAHCERNFLLANTLAREEKLTVDTDVLFAAAFLHDMGVFTPYQKEGVDHTERAAQVAGEVLKPAGFPMDKLPRVQEAMRSHMFYSEVGPSAEARVFHDADTLDFLGDLGVARILSITGRHRWAPTLPAGIATLEKFKQELPAKLVTAAAQKQATQRVAEMEQFLKTLKAQTQDGKAL
jgi:uncharacterized protein